MTAAEFFRWWRTQLAELVPSGLRGSWDDGQATLTVTLGAQRLEVSDSRSSDRASLDLGQEASNEQRARLSELLAGGRGRPRRIRLVVAADEYLLRRLTLPRAAQTNLAEAVGYQLPQLTPFTSDQLLYACGEAADSPAEGPLSVWLVAVPRQAASRALGLIGQVPPPNPLLLKAPPAAGEPVQLGWRVAEDSRLPARRLRVAWAALLGLCLAVFGLHLYKQRTAQALLDAELLQVRARALQVGELRDRIGLAEAQAVRLLEAKRQAWSPLALLDGLTQQLDDRTWLQGLELDGDRVTLRGISASTGTLIGTLEASELLRDVRFEAAITRDGRTQGDRFNISARLETPQSEDGS